MKATDEVWITIAGSLKRTTNTDKSIEAILTFFKGAGITNQTLHDLNKADNKKPGLIKRMFKTTGKKRPRQTTWSCNGIIKIPALLYNDELLNAGPETFKIIKYLGKTLTCGENEIAFIAQSTARKHSLTVQCLKTPEGLEIHGFKKHIPRPELEEY